MPINALIASHHKDQLRTLVEHLLKRGVDVTACVSGPRACAAVMEQAEAGTPFGVVVADVDLPGIPGLRVLYEARRRHLETVVGVICPVARRGEPKIDKMIGKVGADALMVPINVREIDVLVARARERRALAGLTSGGYPVATPLEAKPKQARPKAAQPPAAPMGNSIDISPVLELGPEEFEDKPETDISYRRLSSGELSVAGYLRHGSGAYDEDDIRPDLDKPAEPDSEILKLLKRNEAEKG